MIKPKINKIEGGGLTNSPLTYPCPQCGKYHNLPSQAMKCLDLVTIALQAMTTYYTDLLASSRRKQSDNNSKENRNAS